MLSLKAKIVAAFVCLAVVLSLNLKFVVRHDPDAAESIRILTDFVMKQDFTDAGRLRMDNETFVESYRTYYDQSRKARIKAKLLETDLEATDAQLEIVIDAHLEMDRKRDVRVEVISKAGDKARVRVTLSTPDRKALAEKIAAARTVEAVAAIYRGTDPKGLEASFEIDCEQYALDRERPGRSRNLSRLLMDKAWRPVDMGAYYLRLDEIVL